VISRIHQKLGTAGFVISIVALVAALGGGAYAASGGLSGKQKKEVAKIAQTEAKKFAGKPGAPGATGAAGPAGTAGGAGAKGDKGDQGSTGKAGGPGPAGKSVEVGPAGAGECPSGGTIVEVEAEPATQQFVCNGEDGQTGFTETLPSGKTETGAWALPASSGEGVAPISFAIPLSSAVNISSVEIMASGEAAKPGCTGGTSQSPKADPGFLCIYTGLGSLGSGPIVIRAGASGPAAVELGAGTTGGYLQATALTSMVGTVSGTWAVTAGS
jgi:hypothetical protein